MNKEVTLYLRTGYELIMKGISDDGLATYIALRCLYNKSFEELDVNIEQINYILTNEYTLTKDSSKIKAIKDSLYELDELKVIEIIQCDKRRFLLDMSNLYQSTEISIERESLNPFTGELLGTENEKVNNYYITLELSDIQQALKDNGNKKSIFRYLFYMFNFKAENKDMYFFAKERKELANLTGFDERTIDKYNQILMENHILYIHKYDYKYVSNNRTVNNVYGLFKDKAVIEEECVKFIKEKLDNGEVRKSKTYANKGKNTKKFKESLQKKQEEKLEEEKERKKQSKLDKIYELAKKKTIKLDYYNDYENDLWNDEPTEEELIEIERHPVKLDITPPKDNNAKFDYDKMKAWGFDDRTLKELNIYKEKEETRYQDDFDDCVLF